MKLKKLRLHNYCQYSDKTVDFDKGLAVLTGRNGAGKSNLLNAIFYALTGETSIEGKTRPKMLKWGEKRGYIELIFELDTIEYIVKRNLQSATAKMTWEEDGKEQSINKANDINLKIMHLLRTDANTLLLSSFMPQKGSTKLIFGTNVERVKEFSRLFRMLHLEKIRQLLLDKVNGVEVFQDFSEDIAKLEEELAEVSMKHSKSAADLHRQQELLVDLKDKYAKAIKKANAMSKEEWDKKKADLALTKEKLLTEQVDKTKALEYLGEDITLSSEEIKKYNQYLEVKEKGKVVMELKEKLDAIEVPEEPIMGCSKDDIEKAVQTSLKYKAKYEAYLNKECPTCEQHAEVTSEELSKMAEEATQAANFVTHLRKVEQKYLKAEAEHVKLVHEKAMAQSEYNKAAKEFQELSTMVEDFNEKAFLLKEKQANKSAENKECRKNLEARLNQIGPTILAIDAQVEELDKAGYYEEEGADAEFIKNFEDLRDNLIPESKQKVASLEKEVEMTEKQLAEKVKYTELHDLSEKYKEFLQSVRSVLHVDVFPKKLISAYKGVLTQLVGKYLSVFRQPFCVRIDNDLDVICSFPDNPEVSVHDLSGGQQMLLTVAFRLAISDMTVNNVSFISMDEPTNHLDADSRDYLTETFMRVKEFLKSSDIQMIVSTHEPKVQSIADYIIEI